MNNKNIILNINGRELDFRLGLGLIGELIEVLKMPVEDIGRNLTINPFKYIPIVMYESAKYGRIIKGEDVDFDKMFFIDWFEDVGGTDGVEATKFLKAFHNSMGKNVPKTEAAKNPSKKK